MGSGTSHNRNKLGKQNHPMSNKKISDFSELTTPADGDLFEIVDISDTSEAATGTNKKIQYSNISIADATTTVKGKVELATDAETITGTDTVRAVTPSNITAKMDTDGTLAGNLDTRIPSQKAVKTYGDRSLITTLTRVPLYAPQGFLINGKISVTDTGSGLKVELLTLAGTAPSATDPVYCRIGDTVRSITAAISVTAADGTNWCNAGSAELATKEIDYFAYLIYRTDGGAPAGGVDIGFARIVGTNYSEFSSTGTNEKFLRFGTSGTPTSTDYCEVIGRFAATLSAGAGYTWSVPTFTAINLIQRPIYETRELTWAPTYTGFSAAPATPIARYKVINDTCRVIEGEPNAGTSNATGFTVSLPFTSKTAAGRAIDFSLGQILDNTTPQTVAGMGEITSASGVMSFYKTFGAGTWTAAGTKRNWSTGYVFYPI